MSRLERVSTSQTTTLKAAGGDVQLVPFVGHLGLDVQTVSSRVDGRRERSHSYLILAHADALALRDRITAMVDAAMEPSGQAVLPFRRRAA